MRTNGACAAVVLAITLGACARTEYEFIIEQRELQKHDDLIEDRKQSIIDYGTRVPKQRKLRY